jgi:hypothetical protein
MMDKYMKTALRILCLIIAGSSSFGRAQTNCGGWNERQVQLEVQCKNGLKQACDALAELRMTRAKIGCADGQVGADGWNRSSSSRQSGSQRSSAESSENSNERFRTPVQAAGGAECVNCVNTRNSLNQYAFQCSNICSSSMRVGYSNSDGKTGWEIVRPGENKWMSYTTAPNVWRVNEIEPLR